MQVKVFISYSHKDEHFKEALNEHLSMLKRSNLISEWHDRKLIGGDDWRGQISKNLEEAQLILFLVSSSFLASEYCFDIEFKRALERHAEGTAQLIPVVVRPCDWTTSELGSFQGLPKEAIPIAKWDDQDEGWLNVVQGIKQRLALFLPKAPVVVDASITVPKITLTNATLSWLDDTEVALSHRRVNKIRLSEIYVALDMEQARATRKDELVIKNTSYLLEEAGRYVISGEEQQGKTSLLKNAFTHFAAQGIPVVYIDATSVTNADIEKYLGKALIEQYLGMSLDQLLASPRRVVLLDNVNNIRLNERFRGNFLKEINKYFEHVIVTCSASFTYLISEIDAFDEYSSFELLGLGHVKRSELVEKWISLGVEESISEHELYDQCDEIKEKLDAVIRKNIVPAKPIYILMLLQMFEAGSQQNLDLSSYGHCYQQLIYQSFDNAKIPKKQFDTYLNVLTELSWELHLNQDGINHSGLENFFSRYEQTFLSVDGTSMIEKLKGNSILHERDYKVLFKYPYLFYFFVAKKIAESYSADAETRKELDNLIKNLHREDYANILVFVTHHTKEKWVLDKIDNALQALFSGHKTATLSKDQIGFLQDFIAQIPDLVIEQREIRAERKMQNVALDKLEQAELANAKVEANLSEESKSALLSDLPANINKTFKGMELAGQIIRNRHATLPKSNLLKLAQQGAFTGLRFLTFFIDVSDAAKSEVVKYVAANLNANPELSNEEIEVLARNHFIAMTYGVINGVIRKTALSIGSKEAAEIYAHLEGTSPSPAITLLNQSIAFQFTRKLDFLKLSETYEKLKNNPVCVRILKDMAVQYVYMFPIGYREKQQLSELLKIPVQTQRAIERKKAKRA
jgi:hypothetical protein